MEEKIYSRIEEEDGYGCMTAEEPALAVTQDVIPELPNDIPFAHIVNGALQISPDIEDEISAVERGETVSLGEFKTMFAQWLD